MTMGCPILHGAALNAATFTVTTTADTGAGSLRQAIQDANSNPGPDNITFNIPGTGVQTINPLTPPPIITDTVHIDGYTQPSAATATATSAATILIELSGALLPGGPGVNGITLVAGSSGSSIRGLSINRFQRAVPGTGHAILVSPGFGLRAITSMWHPMETRSSMALPVLAMEWMIPARAIIPSAMTHQGPTVQTQPLIVISSPAREMEDPGC
jgi:hypothetical protein